MDTQSVRYFPSGQMFADRVFAPDKNQLALPISFQKAQCGRNYDARTMVTAHRIQRNRNWLTHPLVVFA